MSITVALHSDAPLVVVEAAAGCGKTWTAARFAEEHALHLTSGRVLLLSHTHAACGEFQRRCGRPGLRITVDTCDSFALKVVEPYAPALGLPYPLSAHLGRKGQSIDFRRLAEKAIELFEASPAIARTIGCAYPTIVLDEHQDSSVAQHRMVMLLKDVAGCRLRAFGDPMQAIHPDQDDDHVDWGSFWAAADKRERLDHPHRWDLAPELGRWIVAAREALRAGKPLKMADAPSHVRLSVHSGFAGRHKFADQTGASKVLRSFISGASKNSAALAFLGPMVRSLAQVSAWRTKVNEGATLEHLDELVDAAEEHCGDPAALSKALLWFLRSVGTGLARAERESIERRLLNSIDTRNAGSSQRAWFKVFECVYAQPDYHGLANAMIVLRDQVPRGFTVRLKDHAWALRSLADASEPRAHLSVLSRLRRRRRSSNSVASTIHKAKGLEFDSVLLCPVDHHQYPNGPLGARLLYVALSRATTSLNLAVCVDNPCEHLDLSDIPSSRVSSTNQ